jgi:diaminohydroxyphosphoribosylaminopyrimidine deaminase/5-amino-6-(5-phosphoribosylamino)uracil reductase
MTMPQQFDDIQHLRRALRLAMNGRGRTEPNPSVGCVIVKANRVIGEGHTQPFGGPHAEPTALANCTESPEGATVYVTLEPCCHTNKKTPPCAPRLIAAKIARVVVGCLDPNPDVDGKGIVILREAGIVVDRVDAEIEAEAKQLIAPFIARTTFRRPYITLKWAETADGKIAGPGGTRMQISNPASMRVIHQLRGRSDAILVGVGTVLKDDPMLTARDVEPSRLHARMILDPQLRTPLDSKLARSAKDDPPVVLYFTRDGFVAAGPERIKQFMNRGVEMISIDATQEGRISIPKLVHHESFGSITHLLVEPGPTLARALFDAGAADRVWVNRSKQKLAGNDALAAPQLPSRFVESGEIELDADSLTEYFDSESDVFFAATPSADFTLTADADSLSRYSGRGPG